VIDVTVGCDQNDAVLEVADRGIGVPAAERDRLFAPFSRTASAIDAGIEGTGLGLYISRKIVEAHGGTIDHLERPGGGTTFRVSLPLERRNSSETASGLAPEAGVSSPGAT
jgi:signal transduction histidine kinase